MKNKVRRKREPETVHLKEYPDAMLAGIPCAVHLVERVCDNCLRGLMRPADQRVLLDNKQRAGIYHECTNEACDHSAHFPHPYPHPDFSPIVDAVRSAPEIGGMTRQKIAARREARESQEVG